MPATFRLRRPRPANRYAAGRNFRPGVELLEGLDLPSGIPFTPPLDQFAQEFRGDFNGDSLDDVAAFDEQGRWVVSLNTGTSFDAPQQWTLWQPPSVWRDLVIGDFNGDGLDDVAGFADSGRWWVGLSDGDCRFLTSSWAEWAGPSNWDSLFVGDFNGDGRDDVAGFANSGRWWVGVSSSSNLFQTGLPWTTWAPAINWSLLSVGDFNGDGRDDVAGFANSGRWWAALSDGISTFATQSPWAVWSAPGFWDGLFVGDFNGDGLDDIAGFAMSGNWWVGLSNGSDAFDASPPWASWAPPDNWARLFVGDFNGDGQADVAGFSVDGDWVVGLSNGASAFATSANPWGQWSAAEFWQDLLVGDFGGNSNDDVAGFAFDDAWWVGLSNGTDAFDTALWVDWSEIE